MLRKHIAPADFLLHDSDYEHDSQTPDGKTEAMLYKTDCHWSSVLCEGLL